MAAGDEALSPLRCPIEGLGTGELRGAGGDPHEVVTEPGRIFLRQRIAAAVEAVAADFVGREIGPVDMDAADPCAISRMPGVADGPAGGEHRVDLGWRAGCRRRKDRRRAVTGVGGERRADGRLVAIHEVGAPSAMDMEIDKPGREKSAAGVDRDSITR